MFTPPEHVTPSVRFTRGGGPKGTGAIRFSRADYAKEPDAGLTVQSVQGPLAFRALMRLLPASAVCRRLLPGGPHRGSRGPRSTVGARLMKLSLYTFVKDGIYYDFHVEAMLRHH